MLAVKTWFITSTSRGFGCEWAVAALDRGDTAPTAGRPAAVAVIHLCSYTCSLLIGGVRLLACRLCREGRRILRPRKGRATDWPARGVPRSGSLLEALRRGESRSLVIRGEAGVGRRRCWSPWPGGCRCRVIGVTAVQSEVELASRRCTSCARAGLDELEGLPVPQREALRITLVARGRVGPALGFGLAVLNVLAEAAADRPLVCVVDDAQWLGTGPRPVLAFVARRGHGVGGLVFAGRVRPRELAGAVAAGDRGVTGPDARALLDMVLTGRSTPGAREIIAGPEATRWRWWSCRGAYSRGAGRRVFGLRVFCAAGPHRGDFPAAHQPRCR